MQVRWSSARRIDRDIGLQVLGPRKGPFFLSASGLQDYERPGRSSSLQDVLHADRSNRSGKPRRPVLWDQSLEVLVEQRFQPFTVKVVMPTNQCLAAGVSIARELCDQDQIDPIRLC